MWGRPQGSSQEWWMRKRTVDEQTLLLLGGFVFCKTVLPVNCPFAGHVFFPKFCTLFSTHHPSSLIKSFHSENSLNMRITCCPSPSLPGHICSIGQSVIPQNLNRHDGGDRWVFLFNHPHFFCNAGLKAFNGKSSVWLRGSGVKTDHCHHERRKPPGTESDP